MKSFTHYLRESEEQKKYVFKIKIAGDLPDNCEDCMETALQQFKVSKFSKGKSSPIQANLLDFPSVKNASVTVFETEVDYPATSAVLAELIANATGISRDCIRVRTPSEEANLELENENLEDQNQPALLTTDYEKSNYQNIVGEKGVSNFLKELTKARKESGSTPYKGANDQLLAKKLHKEKSNMMMGPGPAKSLFGAITNNDPRKGN